jgi:SAM-dependent methyltransferase
MLELPPRAATQREGANAEVVPQLELSPQLLRVSSETSPSRDGGGDVEPDLDPIGGVSMLWHRRPVGYRRMREHQADELRDLQAVKDQLPAAEETIAKVMARVSPHCALVRPGARVLEVGAAQGINVVALNRAGYDAHGVEPWRPAIETGRQLSSDLGEEIDIVEGVGESLPYPDDAFDLVIAISVMEHVHDPLAVFREVHRVLRPEGAFYFHTTTKLARRQNEIMWFPLFAWYPDGVKRRIMDWAAAERPSWIGGTATPAYNWFTPWGVRRDLREIGYSKVLERWDLMRAEELDGWQRSALRAVRSRKPLRSLGEFVKPGSGFLAFK